MDLYIILYWMLLIAIIVFVIGYAVILSHARKVRKNQTTPAWYTHVALAILSIFSGVPAFALVQKIFDFSPALWSIPIIMILGILTINLTLRIIKKYWENSLTRISLKYFD